MDSSLHQIPHNHSSYCEARAAEHHCIANGRHRNIWRAELSKQNSAEAKSEGNKRAADSKYNQSEISHELPRDLTAKHHALPHRAIICASGAYLFMSDMSLFVLNMETHVSYQINQSHKIEQPNGRPCPLWVISGHRSSSNQCCFTPKSGHWE